MDSLTFNIIISNKDSQNIYSDNTPYSFSVELPYVIRLPGEWTCSIESVYSTALLVSSHPPCVHILLDFVRPSIAYCRELRIGGTFQYDCDKETETASFSTPTQHSVIVDNTFLERMHIDILDPELEHCTFLSNKTIVILKFIQKNG